MTAMNIIQSYISLFEALSLEKIEAMDSFVAADVIFKDPFNDLANLPQLKQLLRNTLADIKDPKFQVTRLLEYKEKEKEKEKPSEITNGHSCYILKWEFSGIVPILGQWKVTGYSEITLNESGLISRHVDYWDASEYFYMKLPVIGSLLRWIRKRLQVS